MNISRRLASLPRSPWLRHSRQTWAWLAIGYLALYGLWLVLRPENDLAQLVVGHAAQLLPAGLAAAAALRKGIGQPAYLRWVWTYLGLAALLWAGGGVLWVLIRIGAGTRAPLPSLADLVYMAGHLLALAALASFPILPRGRFGRFRVLIDLAIVSGVSLTLGWVILLQPILTGFTARPADTLWLALYPALDVALLTLLACLALVLEPDEARAAFGPIGAALLALVIADLAYTFLSLRGQAGNEALFDVGRILGFALLGLGALRQTTTLPRIDSVWLRRFRASLPLAAGLALGWFTIAEWQRTGTIEPLAVWMTIIFGIALVARQGILTGETELRQHAQLVDSAADPAFICDAAGRLQLANPAFAAALGLAPADDALDTSILNHLDPASLPREWQATPEALLAQAREAGWSGEVSLRRSDGSQFPVFLSLRPVHDDSGGAPVLAGIAHDLSVQKRQQAALVDAYEAASSARGALQDLNAQLEAKVEEKTSELAQQNEELKTLDQLKSDFVSLVSHELRAPLTNISGGMELTLALSQDLGPRTRQRLTLVQNEIRRLSRFVETILDLSALDAGRLPITLAPLAAASALEPLQTQFAAQLAPLAGHRLRVEAAAPLPSLLADERALASVLFHLVDNALKYSAEGEVAVRAEHIPPDRVRFSVSDHGPGIPPEQRAAIFNKFQRLNSTDAQTVYGHGLGLYMVRRLLQTMHSDIAVADAPGGGACFWFELPITREA
ncbi:MAG: PAS domain-containing sensor histidine kinase [Anaerolineales bacterium]